MKLYLLNDYTNEVFTNEEEAIKQAEELFYHTYAYMIQKTSGLDFNLHDEKIMVEEYRDSIGTKLQEDYDFIQENRDIFFWRYIWSSSVECIYLNLKRLSEDIDKTYRSGQFEEDLLKEFEDKTKAQVEAIKLPELPDYQAKKIKYELGNLFLTLEMYRSTI